MHKSLAIMLLATGLAACATVPTPLQGQFSPITPRDAVSSPSGEAVRWGGEIIKVSPRESSTCIEVLARALDSNARPASRETSEGRFIACGAGFYDPEEYERGRKITIVGRLDGSEQGMVGQFNYTYPRVQASAIYLWPRRPDYEQYPYYDSPWMYGYGFGPGWGGYGPWGPYWGGYGGAIIRNPPAQPPRPPRPLH